MKTPHKHAELIKAWADGAEIEVLDGGRWVGVEEKWKDFQSPFWYERLEYRIKPKPDFYRYARALHSVCGLELKSLWADTYEQGYDNLKLTFDGETGKLKSAEVLK